MNVKKLELVFTGVCAFVPNFEERAPVDEVTAVMVDCPAYRRSVNVPHMFIPRHVAFLAVHKDFVHPGSGRGSYFINSAGYAIWILDKERLSIRNRLMEHEVEFDPSVQYIADIERICGDALPDADCSTDRPENPNPIAAQFVVSGGRMAAPGPRKRAKFSPPCDDVEVEADIVNEVTVTARVDVSNTAGKLVIGSASILSAEMPPQAEKILLFYGDKYSMTVYVGSAPLDAIANLGKDASESARVVGARTIGMPEIHFELFYDLHADLPPDHPRPIPTYQDVGGPLPGTDRCPPVTG